MGSVPAELSLDIRATSSPSPSPSFVPKSITDFLRDLSAAPDKLAKLDEFLARLEDEFSKIHAFKRELPLSMLLLNDAIVVLKAESEKCRALKSSPKPVLEEFIPLKKELHHSDDDDEEEEQQRQDRLHHDNDKESCRDKKSWMSSVQLWNTPSPSINLNPYDHRKKHHHHHHHKLETKKNEEQRLSVVEDLFQSPCRNSSGGRAFMPFSAAYSSVPVTAAALPAAKEEKEDTAINRLSLLTPAPPAKSFREASGSSGSRTSSNRAVSSSSPPAVPQSSLRPGAIQPQQHQQTARKQRRCWSPELHRRFVNALQKLGGSQVATPKQIRELMQVDGLTNDEVKSHLQKYRLHTRRVPSGNGNQNVVVLGGLWMSQGGQQDQYNDSSKGSSSGSGSPQSPLHLAAGGTSPIHGDSMEDDEDAKSDSYSWRSHTHKPGKVNV